MSTKSPRRSAVPWAAALVATSTTLVLACIGTGEAGLRLALRVTAGEAFALFLLAYVAAPLHALHASRATRSLRLRRRELGLSFAVAMFVHTLLIVALASAHAASFWGRLAPTTLVGGVLGLLVAAAMTATSFAKGARWIGPRGWKALHTTGMHLFWGIFLFSYLGRAWPYPAFVALSALVAATRGSAALKRRLATTATQ